MPQLVILAAVGAGAYFGYRWLKRQLHEAAVAAAEQVAAKKAASRSDSAREAGNLIWDEKAGVYRTKD